MSQKRSAGLQQQEVNIWRELRWIWPLALCLGNWLLWNGTCDSMFPFPCLVGISSSRWLQSLRSAESLSTQTVRIAAVLMWSLTPLVWKNKSKCIRNFSSTTQCELFLRSSKLISSSTQIPSPPDFFIHVLKIVGIYCSTYINISPKHHKIQSSHQGTMKLTFLFVCFS